MEGNFCFVTNSNVKKLEMAKITEKLTEVVSKHWNAFSHVCFSKPFLGIGKLPKTTNLHVILKFYSTCIYICMLGSPTHNKTNEKKKTISNAN